MFVTYYLIAINIITFIIFALDKRAAIKGEWRAKEQSLHFWAMIGGSFGAIFACFLLRHKIRKSGFMFIIYFFAIIQIFILFLYYSNIYKYFLKSF